MSMAWLGKDLRIRLPLYLFILEPIGILALETIDILVLETIGTEDRCLVYVRMLALICQVQLLNLGKAA